MASTIPSQTKATATAVAGAAVTWMMVGSPRLVSLPDQFRRCRGVAWTRGGVEGARGWSGSRVGWGRARPGQGLRATAA